MHLACPLPAGSLEEPNGGGVPPHPVHLFGAVAGRAASSSVTSGLPVVAHRAPPLSLCPPTLSIQLPTNAATHTTTTEPKNAAAQVMH